MKRRIAALFLTLALAFSLSIPALAADIRDFRDVSTNDWYYSELNYAVSRGLVNGATANSFNPKGTMTRAEFVTILGRMVGVDPKGATASPFLDVDRDKYYAPYVSWAWSNDIVSGVTDNKFGPNNLVTREQMAVILANYLKSQGVTLPDDPSVSYFRDTAKISTWARDAVETMRRSGLLGGDNFQNCNPKNNLSRAEGTCVLVRLERKLPADQTGSPVEVISVGASFSSTALSVGGTTQVVFFVTPANATNQTLTITSADPAVATVDSSGNITAVGVGSTTITATSANGKSAKVDVLVKAADHVWVNSVKIDPVKVSVGKSVTVKPTISPANATDQRLTYTIDDPSIATVNSSGVVTGVKPGETWIIAHASNGKGYSAKVTVSKVTQAEAYAAMIALKGTYYEGRHWTNDNSYDWYGDKSYSVTHGYGCAAFAFILSDTAFGKYTPARKIVPVKFSSIRVGDILRVDNNEHSVIVLEVRANDIVIAEGNYNSSIHWGRVMTRAEVEKADYAWTRYD